MTAHTRPSKGSKTERVWCIADEITRKTNKKAKRQQVIDAYVAEGGNANTASTQYSLWSQSSAGGAGWRPAAVCGPAPQPAPQPAPAPLQEFTPPQNQVKLENTIQLRIGADGGVIIPAHFLASMHVGNDGKITACLHDGELKLISPSIARRNVLRAAQCLDSKDTGIIGRFIFEKAQEN